MGTGVRGLVQKYRSVFTVLAFVLMVVAVVSVIRHGGGAKAISGIYFYDLSDGGLFGQPLGTLPPVDAPDGAGSGVRAHVFACGSCDEKQSVAFITTLPVKIKQQIDAGATGDTSPDDLVGYNMQIASPPAPGERPKWVLYNSPEGRELQEKAPAALCPGRRAVECYP